MKESSAMHAGVINPYAVVEAKLRRSVDWKGVADRRRFVSTVLGFPYEKLFDPKFESPLYAHAHYDEAKKRMHPRHGFSVADLVKPDAHSAAAGGYEAPALSKTAAGGGGGPGGPGTMWKAAGTFFLNAPDFTAPVQGALPDCHFISAMAALAWSDPYAISHFVRPRNASDGISTGGTQARVPFYPGTGAAPAQIETSEQLPLVEPGDLWQYARSGHAGETWPAVYEKAWVKWFTNDSGDQPDYSKVTGGDPVYDLVSLTGKAPSYADTSSKTGSQIWTDVRSHCRGSWTFDPMVACTYASASAAPTPIDFGKEGLVAWHCYAILGWQYAGGKEYVVLRNPWGYYEATKDVDNGPWTSFDQFEGGLVVGTLDLPTSGVFALLADTFQKYFVSYGWVS